MTAPRFTDPACAGLTHLFVTRPGRQPEQIAYVKAICAGCPHLEPCREWALDNHTESYGMTWGGLTDADRVEVRRQRRQVAT